MTNLTLDIVTGCVFGTKIINEQQVQKTIGQSLTIAMKELEKRMLNTIVFIPLLNQLPIPSKRIIDRS